MKRIVLITLFFIAEQVFSQISPGSLSKAHQEIEGINNCTKCHILGKGLSDQLCLDCHKEIRKRILLNKGYHSSNEVKGKKCWKCHLEHNGLDYKIISWDKKKFDHNKTGFTLNGKHSKILCEDCHNKNLIKEDGLKKLSKTFLGLGNQCIDCHNDIHKSTTSKDCETCHNTMSFNSDIRFDHNQTNFKLSGKHKDISCTDCHKKTRERNKISLVFVNNDSPECLDCHNDIHQGKLGRNCVGCHNTNSFRIQQITRFDHSKTNFPLKGKHISVDCKSCHKQKFTVKILYSKCINCHKDYHQGQFIERKQIQDCQVCHNENGFSPSTFTVEKHNKTKFELNGAHLAVECKACHFKSEKWTFKLSKYQCIDCHRNVHGDEITYKFMGDSNCQNCHNTYSWKVNRFDHNQTTFQLVGVHSKISCSSCHIKNKDRGKVHLFKSLSVECLECHDDTHYKQYNSNECVNCHTFEFWIPTIFNHDNARFRLEGAHQFVNCIKCHPRVNLGKNKFYYQFKVGKLQCTDCH